MKNLINNYRNGNLEDAKAQAKRHGFTEILLALRDAGHGQDAAIKITAYLKGQGTFQAACDAEHAERHAAKM